MARDNRVQMPTSGAGLTRYFDEFKSRIELSPGHIVVLCIFVMVVVLVLHMYGGALIS